jgi:nucleoside phosphorylase
MSDPPIVILTALNLEYNAVRALLTDPRLHAHPAATRFEVGRLAANGRPVALALAGRGNHGVAVIAERAISEFSPPAVLFVGVAGGLQRQIELGDVVVATHVYAYHGGTSEDDGLKARPRVLEIQHSADQIAHHVERTGGWEPRASGRHRPPKVHFGPLAAGEVVHYSTTSEQARWIRQHYNDALAVETEGAGVAQAAQLNGALPVVVVRGISDLADGSKENTDRAGWQQRAAANAAAFATALVDDLARLGGRAAHRTDRVPRSGDRVPRSGDREPAMRNKNVANNSTVGIQAQVVDDGRVSLERPQP